VRRWLDDVANARVHATTKAVPAMRFAEEQGVMLPAPALKAQPALRVPVAIAHHAPRGRISWNLVRISWRSAFLSSAAAYRRFSVVLAGLSLRTAMGFRLSSTATIVKKQLLTCLTACVRISCARTLTPTSMELVPVWLTLARNETSSPTKIGLRKVTWSTDKVTT
jgi:hypothetical protein